MYKLIRFYNQNRKQIIKIILIIVFIIGIIQLLNYLISKNNNSDNNIQTNTSYVNNQTSEIVSNKSLVSGQSLSSMTIKEDNEIIKQFVEFCNKGDVNSAYELLTDECKESMFPTIEDFERIYCSYIFTSYQTYTIENWTSDTYQVRYTGDILGTGDLDNNVTKQDYITVVNKDGEKKLNINNYIGRKNLKRITNHNDIEITVTTIDTYMDYEIYNLSIQNKSGKDILLDTKDDTKSIYLLDSKDMKYYFYNNEISENKLLVKNDFTRSLQIKFMNSYSSSRKIKNLVFSKMVLDYSEYKNLENKENYDYYQFIVEAN